MAKNLKPVIHADLLKRSRAMRQEDIAPAEKKLWERLRNRQLGEHKFRRQHVAAPFIADFFCHELKLVVELDGDSHFEPGRDRHDRIRTERLQRDGMQ